MRKNTEDTNDPKQRTQNQNSALWLWFEWLAKSLNESGKDMRVVLKPTYSIPWTKESIHDHIWIPIQKAMFGTASTKDLTKHEQIDKIRDVIMRELGEKHEIEEIPFPNDADVAPLKDKKYNP